MSQVTSARAVASLSSLLVISLLGNLYLLGLLPFSQERSGGRDEHKSVRRLSPSHSDLQDTRADADILQSMLITLLEQHGLHVPAGFSNAYSSNAFDVTGVLTCLKSVWPGVAVLSETQSPRSLSDDSQESHASAADSESHESPEESHESHSSSESHETQEGTSPSQESHSGSASQESHSSFTSQEGHGSTASHGSGHASGHGEHDCKEFEGEHAHQHDALFFLFNIILLGTGLLHINAIVPKLQFTIMLFLLGLILSSILEGIELKCQTGILGKSYLMWMEIDPHLLLFTMLPALLAGDAMTIDTSVAKRVSLQCLYLAGPGVVVSAFSIAIFLKFYLSWSFLLSLTTASILCATDPVAVVALLKELGASPVLTVQIQGESLLNDGTAIVLYTVAYEMLSGVEYDTGKVVMFLVKTALMACALGCFIGYFFFTWIRIANDRFKHAAGVIQILLTLLAAYWSFIMAEGVFHMSGVLATVCSSLVLAHHMWPHMVSKETLQHFWHCLEELMNIIIFLLAGSLCGQVMVHIEPIDYLHLIVIYLVLTVGRGLLIFGSRPLLKILSYDNMPVTMSDAAVMTWGGLRGAVGLALAIQVKRDRAANEDGVPQLAQESAYRVMFFVGGVAFLTTTVNASTCPLLVKALGITALPRARCTLLKKFKNQIVAHSHGKEHPKSVNASLHDMLHHIEEEINEKSQKQLGHQIREKVIKREATSGHLDIKNLGMAPETICKSFEASLQLFNAIPKTDKKVVNHPEWDFDELTVNTKQLCDLVLSSAPDKEMCKMINRTFMKMVANSYEQQIKDGDLRPGSQDVEILFSSVRYCISPLTKDLKDFEYIHHCIADDEVLAGSRTHVVEEDALTQDLKQAYQTHGKSSNLPSTVHGSKYAHAVAGFSGFASAAMHQHFHHIEDGMSHCLDKIVRSQWFSWASILAIILNAVGVVLDEMCRTEENQGHSAWLIMEWAFTIVFFIEAVLKFVHHPRGYLKDIWNKFDVFLVVVGIAGAVMSTIEFVNADEAGSSTLSAASRASRTIRIAKVLRSLRLLRIFLLVHAVLSRDKYISHSLAVNMLKLQTLTSFVQAHMSAQRKMKKFFVGNDEIEDPEIARCLLQSLTSIYKALISVISVERSMKQEHGNTLLDELQSKKQVKRITEELEEFVLDAEESGAISSQEAHAIMHPMYETLANCLDFVNALDDGVISREKEVFTHDHGLIEEGNGNEPGHSTDVGIKLHDDEVIAKEPEPHPCAESLVEESKENEPDPSTDAGIKLRAALPVRPGPSPDALETSLPPPKPVPL